VPLKIVAWSWLEWKKWLLQLLTPINIKDCDIFVKRRRPTPECAAITAIPSALLLAIVDSINIEFERIDPHRSPQNL